MEKEPKAYAYSAAQATQRSHADNSERRRTWFDELVDLLHGNIL